MINMAMLDSHVDFNIEETQDVVTFTDLTDVVLLDPRFDKRENIYFMPSSVEVHDSVFQIFEKINTYTRDTFQFHNRQ